MFLAQTGCAKDAQLCSCSVMQAAFTENPFCNTLFGPNPAHLCWSLPWPQWGSHFVE